MFFARTIILSGGTFLLILVTALTHYRATHPPDSNAIAVYEENYYESVAKITRIDMVGNQTRLFASSFYDELQIEHYAWSPDGHWMLILSRDHTRYSELHVVSVTGEAPTKIYSAAYIFDFPRWAQDSESIFVAEHLAPDDKSQVRILEVNRTGNIQQEIIFDAETRTHWDFDWFDTQTLWLSYSPSRPSGYFIDTQSGQITPNEQAAYLRASNGVSPNGLWSININPSHIQLDEWGTRDKILWSIPIGQAPITPALRLGWSADSAWVALLTYPLGLLNSPTPSSSDIVIIDKLGKEIRPLINDNRAKDLILTEPRTNLIRPFSQRNGWLVYMDLYAPAINAVRTDGSGEEMTDWYICNQPYSASVKWSPPYETSFEAQRFQFAGGLLVLMILGWRGWQMRRYMG